MHDDHPFAQFAAEAERRFREGGRGRRGGPHHHGRGQRGGGWQQADLPDATDAAEWFAGRLPDDWFTGTPEVSVDRDEIVVVGELTAPDDGGTAAAQGRIQRFREETRDARMRIADEAEARYGRKVAWGAAIGDTRELFTTLSVPVMTRLRSPERQVLDTLVDSGVARSRADALVWCVRLVGQHADEWLGQLRDAMAQVDELRKQGPTG
ncbi:hypothetical protein [Jatrophihabitans fulvus]